MMGPHTQTKQQLLCNCKVRWMAYSWHNIACMCFHVILFTCTSHCGAILLHIFCPLIPFLSLSITGLVLTPGLVPLNTEEVRSDNTAATDTQFRYNLNTGAAFTISCSSTHTSDAFTVSFYKDGVVISEGDLEDTTLTETVPSSTQKDIQLEFLNFQPVHDGVYHCFSNTINASVVESSDLYLYGSGEDCTCVLLGCTLSLLMAPPSLCRVSPSPSCSSEPQVCSAGHQW